MKMLFLRDYDCEVGLTGGHIKYLDYLRHASSLEGVEPELFLTPRSFLDPANPFLASGVPIVSHLQSSDSYFVAGIDWGLLDRAGVDPGERPVLNLVQSISHASPGDPKFVYLSRFALRICVSAAVEAALRATHKVRGDIRTIENRIDIAANSAVVPVQRRSGVFIAGSKAPQLSRALAERLEPNTSVDLADQFILRENFLHRLGRAKLCVLLPNVTEGFYLPALEAMALGTPVIVPDCIGNRTFCRNGENCITPDYDLESLVQAVRRLMGDEAQSIRLSSCGLTTAAAHTLEHERNQFANIVMPYLQLNPM